MCKGQSSKEGHSPEQFGRWVEQNKTECQILQRSMGDGQGRTVHMFSLHREV